MSLSQEQIEQLVEAVKKHVPSMCCFSDDNLRSTMKNFTPVKYGFRVKYDSNEVFQAITQDEELSDEGRKIVALFLSLLIAEHGKIKSNYKNFYGLIDSNLHEKLKRKQRHNK